MRIDVIDRGCARKAGPRTSRRPGEDGILATRRPDGVDAQYRRHQPMVYRYCMSIVRTPEVAADAAQSTWMRAIVALSAPDMVVRDVRPWLRAIARNECFDVLRARGALQTLDISALELSTGTTLEDAYEAREQLGSLVADLQGLSERQRSAIVLRELCGLTSKELAGELETTPERASGLVADARRTLTQRRAGRMRACPDVRRQLREGRCRRRVKTDPPLPVEF